MIVIIITITRTSPSSFYHHVFCPRSSQSYETPVLSWDSSWIFKCTYLMKRLITPNNVIFPFSCTYFNFPWCNPSQQIFGSKPVLWVLNTEHSVRQSKTTIIIIIIIISIEFSSEYSWWNCSPCNNRSLLAAYDCTPVGGNPCRTVNGSLSYDSVPGMIWLAREGYIRHTGPARCAFSCFLF